MARQPSGAVQVHQANELAQHQRTAHGLGDIGAGEAAVGPVRAAEVGQRTHDGRAARTHDPLQFLHQVMHACVAADTQNLHQPKAVGGVGGPLRQRQARGVRPHAQHVGACGDLRE